MLKLTTNKHKASRGFYATAELLVIPTLWHDYHYATPEVL